jgi:hypothetical protein
MITHERERKPVKHLYSAMLYEDSIRGNRQLVKGSAQNSMWPYISALSAAHRKLYPLAGGCDTRQKLPPAE